MTEKEILYITTVAECGSITKASEKLFIAQPSLTQFLRRSEEEYGVPLFYRERDGVRPTEAGELFIASARRVSALLDTLNSEIRDLSPHKPLSPITGSLALRYLAVVASCGSSSTAASEIGVSRSSVRRNIRELEAELGARVLDETPKGISLTPVGAVCAKYAHLISKEDDDLRFDLAGEDLYHGKIDIAMGASRSQMISMFILPDFLKKYPNVSIRIHELNTTEISNQLIARRLDLAVVSFVDEISRISYEYLMTERLVMVAPNGDDFARESSYVKNGRQYADLSLFKDKPFILGYSAQKSRRVSEAAFRRAGIEPKIVLQTGNNINAAMLAHCGMGYALVPESSTARDRQFMAHYYIEPDDETSWSICVASLASEELSRIALELKETMRHQLSDAL